MAKRTNATRVILDWQRLLGFDQATDARGVTAAATLNPKIGPKEARGFSDCSTLGAKIGPKEARGFGRGMSPIAAKVGSKDPDPVVRLDLGYSLNAKVGVKFGVSFGTGLPISVTAKIGFKET